MGNPDNSPPARPITVPPDARWDPKDPGFEWIVGSVDAQGRRHGLYRSWTRDGLLHGECSYDHGKVHGKNINFHPDGTIASEAEWVNGVIMNSAFFRCAVPTPEPFAQAAPNVWTARYYTRDGKTNYTIRYFLKDGSECGPDGKPLPPRPASVSSDARWFPEIERWIDGEIERGTNKQVGRWRWWTRDGVLRQAEARGDITERDYYDNGQLVLRQREDDRGRPIYKATWEPTGELVEEREVSYDDDAIGSVTERGPDGMLRLQARREGGLLACVLYQADGKTFAAAGMHTGEQLTGMWRLFDETGAVRREVDVSALDIRHDTKSEGFALKLGEALLRTEPAGTEPGILRGLTSAEPLVRAYCLATIERELDARVIPHLAKLLAHPNADRAALLTTIQNVGADDATWPDIFAVFGRCSLDEKRMILGLATPAGMKDVLAIARTDPDPRMRAWAIDTFTATDDYAVADAMTCLADRDALVRGFAAIAIAQSKGPQTPREVVAVLRETILGWRELAPRFAQITGDDAHVLAYLAIAAGAVGSPDARSLAQHLCERLDEVDRDSAVPYVQGLLHLAFGEGDRPFAKRFLEILETVADSAHFWPADGARDVLAQWNLPQTPGELRALVRTLESSPDPEGAMHARLR